MVDEIDVAESRDNASLGFCQMSYRAVTMLYSE
jgi:hypothetical protein